MANYYWIDIESKKMTQDVANEILQVIAPKQLIRHFEFTPGELHYNTRGFVEINEILNCYGFDQEDSVSIKDEFELICDEEPKVLTEEAQQALTQVKQEINKIKDMLKDVNLSMPSLPELDNNYWWLRVIK